MSRQAGTARISDRNEWWEVKRNPLSKVGVFPYSGASLMDAPDANAVYRVLRPADELGSPEALASFRLVPLVDDHTMLGSPDVGLTPAEMKGVQGVIGEEVDFDGETLFGNLKIFSEYLKGRIDNGKRELSLGYRCTYDWTPGVWNGIPYDAVQRNIRGNHVALVDMGRMGPDVAVLDHFTIDAMEHKTMSEKDEEKGGEGGLTLADLKNQLDAMKTSVDTINELKAQVDAFSAAKGEGEGDAAKKAADATAEALDSISSSLATLTKKVDDRFAAMDSAGDVTATTLANIAARDALAAKLVPHIGAFDHAEKTHAQVAAYGCEKLGLAPSKGAEVVALDAYLKDRPAPRAAVFVGDSADATLRGKTDKFLSGE